MSESSKSDTQPQEALDAQEPLPDRATIEDPVVIRKILIHLGLPTEASAPASPLLAPAIGEPAITPSPRRRRETIALRLELDALTSH